MTAKKYSKEEKLAPNFKLGEFFQSAGSWAWFQKQTADKQWSIYMNLLKLAQRLQMLRDIVGQIDITSGVRTPERNRAVGGAGNSTHLDGRGCDFTCADMSRAQQLCKNWSGGYAYYPSDRHIHVDIRPGKPRGFGK